MDWIDLAQDRDKWWALVITVRNLWFRKMLGNSWLDERLAAYQGLSSVVLAFLFVVYTFYNYTVIALFGEQQNVST
jgi:hypothetical protein